MTGYQILELGQERFEDLIRSRYSNAAFEWNQVESPSGGPTNNFQPTLIINGRRLELREFSFGELQQLYAGDPVLAHLITRIAETLI